jgi:hypothetical protein
MGFQEERHFFVENWGEIAENYGHNIDPRRYSEFGYTGTFISTNRAVIFIDIKSIIFFLLGLPDHCIISLDMFCSLKAICNLRNLRKCKNRSKEIEVDHVRNIIWPPGVKFSPWGKLVQG